jgi:hypothetical protein
MVKVKIGRVLMVLVMGFIGGLCWWLTREPDFINGLHRFAREILSITL